MRLEDNGAVAPESKESPQSYSNHICRNIICKCRIQSQYIARNSEASHAKYERDPIDDEEKGNFTLSTCTLPVFPGPMTIPDVGHKYRRDTRNQ